jgi:hypothetical protein
MCTREAFAYRHRRLFTCNFTEVGPAIERVAGWFTMFNAGTVMLAPTSSEPGSVAAAHG